MTTKTEAKFYRLIVSEQTNKSVRCEGVFDSIEEAKEGDWPKLLPSRYRTILGADQLSKHDWLVVGGKAGLDPHTCDE